MQTILANAKARIQKCIADLQAELAKIRSGRASLAILEDVRVEYYGNLSPLNQVATLNVPEPRLITIQPWDAGLVPAIEKAICKAGLGLTPANDGKIIRLPMPALTEERRKELVKVVKRTGEEHRVTVRTIRRDALEELKKMAKERSLPEDETKRMEQEIQKQTDAGIKQIDAAAAHKEKEVMTV
ncbi:MAG: ribosome recycling factor [Deltaproteobacteria bacterium]|nr:ribosome recycling factor [Deltaproteobacteria bacterium]